MERFFREKTKLNTLLRILKEQKKDIRLYRLLPLLSVFLIIISGVFIGGYILGTVDSKNNYPIPVTQTPTETDVPFKADFEITPLPPDESSWIAFNGYMHFHNYTFKLPPEFTIHSSNNGKYVFESTDGSTMMFNVGGNYQPVKKARYVIDNVHTAFTQNQKNNIDSESATFDFLNENLIVDFKGSISLPFFYFRHILNTLTYSTDVPDYSSGLKVAYSQLINFTYPAYYVEDSLFQDTTNCQDKPESIFNLVGGQATIHVDINKCEEHNSYTILSATKETINKIQYFQVLYSDGTVCYLDAQTKNIQDLSMLPLKEWPFAPKDTLINGYPTRICTTTNTRNLNPRIHNLVLTDLSHILQTLAFN